MPESGPVSSSSSLSGVLDCRRTRPLSSGAHVSACPADVVAHAVQVQRTLCGGCSAPLEINLICAYWRKDSYPQHSASGGICRHVSACVGMCWLCPQEPGAPWSAHFSWAEAKFSGRESPRPAPTMREGQSDARADRTTGGRRHPHRPMLLTDSVML
jgi:hypothetical protein